jgi:hypothetical protein
MIYDKFEKLNDEKHGRVISALVGISRLKFNSLAIAFAAAYLVSDRKIQFLKKAGAWRQPDEADRPRNSVRL